MKRRHRAIGSPTKAEQAYQDAQRADGCAMCKLLGVGPCGPVSVHHRTTGDLHGQLQLGHDATVALGDWHHQGVPLPGLQAPAMKLRYGPSLQLHKREFVETLQDMLGERSTGALQRYRDDWLPPAVVEAVGR